MTTPPSWDALCELERRVGDSFYLVSLDTFEANYTELLGAFRARYPRSNLAYSYKTNYLPRFCQIVQRLGGYAEVVSRLEYDLALRVGVPPERILFNGPYKTEDDLAASLSAGAVVNLDEPYQLALLEQVARRHPGTSLAVGLRVNFAAGSERRSRFGFDADTAELRTALTRVRAVPNARVAGLHCHFMPPQRSADAYRRIAVRMIELADELFGAHTLDFVDVGGGFFSKMSDDLARSFGVPIPSFENYADAIATPFAARYPTVGPELILEPGLAVVADAVRFATRVLDARVLGDTRVLQVSGSVYDVKPTLHQRNLPVHVVRPRSAPPPLPGPFDVAGYSCMEHDRLHRGLTAPVAIGDYLVFDNAGAYTNVLKPPFIRPSPCMIAIEVDGCPGEILKYPETLDHIFATYAF